MSFNQALATTLAGTLNTFLDNDPQKAHILELLTGHSLQITLTDWQLSFMLQPRNSHVAVTVPTNRDEPDCCIAGPIRDLLALAGSDAPLTLIQQQRIEQLGDPGVLNSYHQAMQAFECHLPARLHQLPGPTLRFWALQPFSACYAWFKQSLNTTATDIREYLHEEKRCFPPREEIEDFFDDVHELALQVERLEARLTRHLQSHRHSTPGTFLCD